MGSGDGLKVLVGLVGCFCGSGLWTWSGVKGVVNNIESVWFFVL